MTGETLNRDEDIDSEHAAYGISATSNTSTRPWDEQNHIIRIGFSAESLLESQIKNNPNFLRDFHSYL